MRIETIIIQNCLTNDQFVRQVLPYVKSEYFTESGERVVFDAIREYINSYNSLPTKEALLIEADQSSLTENQYAAMKDIISSLADDVKAVDQEWLLDKTEKFCKDKALYLAIMKAVSIYDGDEKVLDTGALPQIMSEALAVSFDNKIGHDFLEDASARYDFYKLKEERVPFDLDYLNRITKGGLPNKTLNAIIGGTGVGKTLVLCHFAAANLMMGKNVLYITMEMAEERIAERIDANLLNIPLDELDTIEKSLYDKKVAKVKGKTAGKLIVKEYPTAGAGSNHFRHLLNELKLKKNFRPDIIYIDYLNICCSSRIKMGGSVNSYTYIKSIAEELRGLAIEQDVPIVTATQTNRSGQNNSDVDFENVSDSHGLAMTLDSFLAISTNDELHALGQIMFKQLKNRFSDVATYKRFVVGCDRPRMRLFDVEQSVQEGLVDDTPIMNNSTFGQRDDEAATMAFMTKKAGKRDFSKLQ